MKLKNLALTISILMTAQAAHAANVTVWGEALSGFNPNTINNFYNGLSGHSSSIASGTLDTVNLSNTNLLWATQPADAYSTAELNTMASFLGNGGRIAFMGEHGSFSPSENIRINAALSFLGADISINNTILDSGFRSASVVDGQILSHSLTTGVNTYQYAAFAPLTVSGSAVALMLGEDQYNGTNSVMMAYQNIGPGSIFLITDQNVWDNSPTWGGAYDNGRMFENLLSGNTGAPPVNGSVPEPESLALIGLGFAALTVVRRRKA